MNDDGTEATATFMAAGIDTNFHVVFDLIFRLRICMVAVSGAFALTPTLYFSTPRVNAGTFTRVNASSACKAVNGYNAAGYDNTATTKRLSVNGAWVGGKFDNVDGSTTLTGMSSGYESEFDFCLQIPSGGAILAGDTVTLKILNNGSTGSMNYTYVPGITLDAAASFHSWFKPREILLGGGKV